MVLLHILFYRWRWTTALHELHPSPADDCLWPCQPPPSSAHPRRCPINKNTFCKEVERVNPREEFLSAKRRQRASLIVSQFMALKREKIAPSRTISSYRWLSAVSKSFIRGCCCWLQLPCRIRNNMTIGKGRQRHQEKAAARDTRLLAKGWRKEGRISWTGNVWQYVNISSFRSFRGQNVLLLCPKKEQQQPSVPRRRLLGCYHNTNENGTNTDLGHGQEI